MKSKNWSIVYSRTSVYRSPTAKSSKPENSICMVSAPFGVRRGKSIGPKQKGAVEKMAQQLQQQNFRNPTETKSSKAKSNGESKNAKSEHITTPSKFLLLMRRNVLALLFVKVVESCCAATLKN